MRVHLSDSSKGKNDVSTQPLKDAFEAFRWQCMWLQDCYNMYKVLFESDADTSDLLRRSARTFFSDLNLILVEYCLLQACR